MKINNMRLVNGTGKTQAFFSAEYAEDFVVNDCKLIEGKNGLFASTPSREYIDKKTNEKKYQPIVYLGQERLKALTAAAREEYDRLTGGQQSTPQDDSDIPF